ncbi:galactosyltransferase amine-terminal domain protein, partial [Cystoisospora suis]
MNAAVAWILRHLLQNNEEQKVDQEEEENTSPPHSSCSSSPPPSSSSPSSSSSSYDHASRLSSPLRSLSSSFFFTPPEKILSSSETSGEMRSLKEHGDDPKTKRKGEVATSQGTTGEKKERRKEDPRPFYTCIGELIDSLPLLSRVSLCFHDVDILPRRRQLDSVTSLPTHRLCLYVPLPVEGCVHHLYGHRWSLGGVLILRSLDFLLKAKGWSVRYPGWGYEDDDMLARCLHADLWIDQSSSIMTKLTRKEERERKLLPPDSSSSSSLSSLPLRQGGVVRVKQREEEDKRDNMTRQHDESKKRSFDDPLKEERKSETREKRRKSLEKAWCACGCFSERFSPLSPFEEFDVHRFLSHQDRLRHMHKQLQTAQAKRNRRLFMRTWRLEEEEKEQEEEEADEDNNDEKEDVVVDEAQDTHEKDKEDEGRGDEDNEDIHEEEEREGLLIRSERGCGDSGTRHEKEEDRKKKKRKRRNGEEGKGEERGRPPPIEVEDGVDVVFKAWLETHPHAEENRQKPPKISIDVSQNSLKNLFPFMTLATQEKDYDDEERQKRNETRSTRREGERRLDRRIDSCGKEENRRDEDWNTDQTRHAEKEKEEAEKDEQHHSKSDT